MRLALLAIIASCVFAQTGEIRGVIVEEGLNTPIPGAQVTLTGFFPANDTLEERKEAAMLTDEKGRFRFKPPLGEYRVDISKPGYTESRATRSRLFIVLTADRPSVDLSLPLLNPSGITGRFVDEQDRPVPNLHIMLEALDTSIGGAPLNIRTEAQGEFSVDNIPPGRYLVRAMPMGLEIARSIPYTEAAAGQVDREFETAFWPSGAANDRDALPLNVIGGSVANLGTLRIRKVAYYRVHLRLDGECVGQGWKLAVIPLPQYSNFITFTPRPIDCARDLLVGGLLPGSYQFALSNNEAPFLWATAQVNITNGNTRATLRLNPAVDVRGRFVAAEGSKLPSMTPPQPAPNAVRPPAGGMSPPANMPIAILRGTMLRGSLRPEPSGLANADNRTMQIAPDGTFVFPDRLWDRYKVSVIPPNTHYVSRIRYGGQLIGDGRITPTPGSELEIELDEHPATLTVNLQVNGEPPTDAYLVFLGKTPVTEFAMEGGEPFSYTGYMESPGVATFQGLAPGEYRVLAFPTGKMLSPRTIRELGPSLAAGERVVLERGRPHTLDLKLRTP